MPVSYPVAFLGADRLLSAEVSAGWSVPWRTARLDAVALTQERVTVRFGYRGGLIVPVFEGLPDDLSGDRQGRSAAALVRGLPHWRREIGPKGFQDGRLETVLSWIARECGGQIDLNVIGKPMRHYQVRRGPAHQAVREALLAWRVTADLLELDGGTLHVGPEDQSPHATAPPQAQLVQGRNLYALSDTGRGLYRLALPGMPWLRVGHRVQLKHERVRGLARVTELTHRWDRTGRTWLEVETL